MAISALHILMKALASKIEAVVICGICTRDHPEGIWDFPFIGLARTRKYNALCKIIIFYVCLQALMNVGYMDTPYKLFECSWTSWLD